MSSSSIAASSLSRSIRGPRKYLAGLQWFLTQKGHAATNHFEAGAFIRSQPGIEHPDLQLTFMPLAVKPGSVDSVPEHAFQVHIDLMRPKSLGHVRARSADPKAPPAILFNYMAEEQDWREFRAGLRITRTIMQQKALAPYRGREISPGADCQTPPTPSACRPAQALARTFRPPALDLP